jgi:superfamily I DNA/RNA helicase
MPLDHLAKLNIEQRRAVEHGGGEAAGQAAPLLVIAGVGSGKTNTLAHRVANLIVNGVDPRRLLLMTFSRRAASEMSRRVESICAKVMGPKGDIMTDALTWAGTFHAIGARLLREYAEQIGLQPNSRSMIGRFGRPDKPLPAPAGVLPDQEPLSDQRHLRLNLFACCQRRDGARRRARDHCHRL